VAYILVIDDDPEIRELLEILLSDEGYEVGTAASASGAMDLIASRHPDLILLDLRLQGQTGESFTEAYRVLPNATASLVLLSAAADLEQVAATIGVDRYLSKPFDLDDLLQMLTELLGADNVSRGLSARS
jgi:CheY-like chemotaxis protein